MNNFLKKRIRSFKYAFRGIATLFRETPNAKIHLFLAVLAVVSGLFFSISSAEWLAVITVIGLVFALEAVNSAIETLSDVVCKERNPSIKKAKDLAAGGVLLAALSALGVGILIFLPRIIHSLFN